MIKYCEPLSSDKLNELKEIYYSQPKQESDGYKMACLEPALAVLRDYVSNELGHNYWKCNQGNYFEAYHPYRIHADTSADEHNHQTIVFPLDWTHEDNARVEDNSLYIFKQILFQVLFSLAKAQEACEFMHNDLHLKNILINEDKKY